MMSHWFRKGSASQRGLAEEKLEVADFIGPNQMYKSKIVNEIVKFKMQDSTWQEFNQNKHIYLLLNKLSLHAHNSSKHLQSSPEN